MNFEIPEGLTDLLQDFTVEVLRKRPSDILGFAAQYFEELVKKREAEQVTQQESNKNQNDEEDEDDEMGDIIDMPKRGYGGGRRHSVAAEKYNPEEDTSEEPDVVNPKSNEEREYLIKTLADIFIFRSLEQKQMDRVIDAMFGREVTCGDVIIEQGDDGDNFYVIESGVYDITVNGKNVGEYNEKGSFGELALMYNMPRAATITAKNDGKLWALDRLTFKRIVLKSAFEKRKMYEGLLEKMPMFKSLNAYERMNVADALFSKSYNDGDAIIKQDEEAKNMFFVETGKVRIVREQDGKNIELAVCEQGGYFGELALLTKKPRAATVYASGPDTKCAILDVDAFVRLLGPCKEIMQKNISDYEDTLKKLFGEKFNLADL